MKNLLPYDFWRDNQPTKIPRALIDVNKIPYTDGSAKSKICFIGEAPGELEEKSGKPFVGGSGKLLREILRNTGIDSYKDTYITNVMKVRPPDNKALPFIRTNPQTFQQHVKLLAGELANIEANVFVPIGNIALQILTGKDGIMKWRGSILSATLPTIAGRKCVPIIHPAATLRNWTTCFPVTQVDLKRIQRESLTSTISLPSRHYILRPNYETVITYLAKVIANKGCMVSVDVETLYNKIVSVQLAIDPMEGIAIPFTLRNGQSYWPISQEMAIWKLLQQILEGGEHKLVGQNFITFDTFMFWMHGFSPKRIHANVYIDTMFAMQCYQPQLPKGLDFLTSIYTREPFYKDEGKEWDTKQGEEEFWTYGCKDACITLEVAHAIKADLVRHGMWDFYRERYIKMSLTQLIMTVNGLPVDREKKKELTRTYGRDIIKAQAELTNLLGHSINVYSTKQMKQLFYEDMKLPKQYKINAAGEYVITCDKNAILKLSTLTESPVLKQVLRVRELRTLYSNNITATYDSDGRIRCSYGFTETGRWTSYKSPNNSGGNIQNWTKSVRVMIKAPEGRIFGGFDLSQAEARVVAWRARDATMIEIFESGKDIHSETASLIFEKPVAQIDKVTERYPAKRIVHASNYDMHSPRFAMVYNADIARFNLNLPFMTVPRATFLQGKYHEKIPNIRNVYQRELRDQVARTKRLENVFGRKIQFHDRIGPDLFRAAYAFYAQSTVADLTNTILMRMHDELADIITIHHQMHDGALFSVKESDLTAVLNRIFEIAQIPLMIEGRPLIIPIEFDAGANWKDMKEVKI